MILIACKSVVVLFSCLSAAFWLKAGMTKVKPVTKDGWTSGGLTVEENGQTYDVGMTLWVQARWSGWGAWCAAVAAAAAALAMLLEA